MDSELNLVIQSAQHYARDAIIPKASEWAKAHNIPKTVFQEMGKLGFMGMLVPTAWQGSEIGYNAYALVIEEIAAADASCSTVVSVHNSMICMPVLNYGNEQQKQKFLPEFASGNKIGAFALTEPEAGSDASEIQTKAVLDGEHYIINGSKQFITYGKTADFALIFAKTDPAAGKKGISAFIVPTDIPGYTVNRIEDKMGQHAAEAAHLIFDNLKVAKENLLGEEGQGYKIALNNLEAGRIGIAAQAIGVARNAFNRALQYAKERKTFGKPIINHQAIAFKLADMATQITAARALVKQVTELKSKQNSCLQQAAMAKLFATEMAEQVCSAAIQVHGGYGYLKDFSVEQLYRDIRVATLYEGTSEIQRMIIARELEKG